MKHRLAAAAAAAALTVALAGCNFLTPQATTVEYDAADGVSGSTGTVEIRNALLVQEDGLASLAVTFVNNGGATTLEIDVAGSTQQISVDEGLTAYGFPDGEQLVFPLDVMPGSLADVVFQADGADSEALQLQVFSTESVGYETLGPEAPVETEEADEEADPQPSQVDESDPALTETPAPTDDPESTTEP